MQHLTIPFLALIAAPSWCHFITHDFMKRRISKVKNKIKNAAEVSICWMGMKDVSQVGEVVVVVVGGAVFHYGISGWVGSSPLDLMPCTNSHTI